MFKKTLHPFIMLIYNSKNKIYKKNSFPQICLRCSKEQLPLLSTPITQHPPPPPPPSTNWNNSHLNFSVNVSNTSAKPIASNQFNSLLWWRTRADSGLLFKMNSESLPFLLPQTEEDSRDVLQEMKSHAAAFSFSHGFWLNEGNPSSECCK